jgi:FtsP/CotA-like multicopper oxidase with cupredoxin domain
VASGEPLIVHLRNSLTRGGQPIQLTHVAAYGAAPVPVSIQIPGLARPRFAAGVAADCSGPTSPVDADGRIRSFTSEVANQAIGTYCWDTRPGTFVYQSGTHPAVQVQMGLYGAVVVGGAAGSCSGASCAYPGVSYDREVVAVYSEIDPLLHAAVANNTYGDASAANPKTSTIVYAPQYFFVDGAAAAAPFTSLASIAAGAPGNRILIRLANAGIESHAPLLQGSHISLVAEDGNPYDASLLAHRQYSTLLAAGKTIDAIFTPTAAGTYPLFDRRRVTTHAVAGGGSAVSSGMLVRLVVQ